MKKSQELKKAAAETYSAAAEYGNTAFQEAVAKAQQLLREAVERSGPALRDAKTRSAAFAAERLDDLEPRIKGALDKVTPAVDAARLKLSDEVLPKLQEVLHEAAGTPIVGEVAERGAKGVKALSRQVEPKGAKCRRRAKTFFKFVAIGALVAGAAAALRQFLAPKDDGWTAHEPSKAYVNNNDTFATAARFASQTVVEEEPVAPAEEAEVVEEVLVEEAVDAETQTNPTSYGEGAYVGDNPPQGFHIKGNERSMKYHLPGTGGYERTIAEVWFSSEEAAEAAGFTKAQR